MEASAASYMAASAAKAMAAAAAEAFRHCGYISRKAERADSNAGRKNSYGSFDGGFHGRFSIVVAPATPRHRGRRASKALCNSTVLTHCGFLDGEKKVPD
jgi:hypothetical protein